MVERQTYSIIRWMTHDKTKCDLITVAPDEQKTDIHVTTHVYYASPKKDRCDEQTLANFDYVTMMVLNIMKYSLPIYILSIPVIYTIHIIIALASI